MRKPIKRTRVDSSQQEIVKALRKFGVCVEIIGFPVDLLTKWAGLWLPLECKPDGWKGWGKTKQEQDQKKFCEDNDVPVVRNAAEAIKAVCGYDIRRRS